MNPDDPVNIPIEIDHRWLPVLFGLLVLFVIFIAEVCYEDYKEQKGKRR